MKMLKTEPPYIQSLSFLSIVAKVITFIPGIPHSPSLSYVKRGKSRGHLIANRQVG